MPADPPARLLDLRVPESTIAVASAALADRYAGLQVRCQRVWDQTGELVHRSRVQRARRQVARLRAAGLAISPPGWFAVEASSTGKSYGPAGPAAGWPVTSCFGRGERCWSIWRRSLYRPTPRGGMWPASKPHPWR
jgi:hypothetical protein